MGILDRLSRRKRGSTEALPSAPGPDHPLAAEHAALDAYLEEILASGTQVYYEVALNDTETGRGIAAAPAEANCRMAQAMMERIDALEPHLPRRGADGQGDAATAWRALVGLLRALLRRKLPFSVAEVAALADWLIDRAADASAFYSLPYGGGVKSIEDSIKRDGPDPAVAERASRLLELLDTIDDRDARKLCERLRQATGQVPAVNLTPHEVWSDAARADIAAAPPAIAAAWAALLTHCQGASAGKPARRWIDTAGKLLDDLGDDAFRAAMLRWFPLVDRPRVPGPGQDARRAEQLAHVLSDRNADTLKGLAWCCGLREDGDLARSLAELAQSAYRKVPGIGPRAPKVGNACVWALGNMPGDAALAALAVLRVRVKFATAQKGIARALDEVAARAGLTRAQLEEIGVPAYGMQTVGVRRETFGEHAAELAIVSATRTEIRWTNAAGKRQKSVPKAVRTDHADGLKELKSAAKDIEKMLVAQRDRLDGLFLARRAWPLAAWRERYLDHPLVGSLARRLIWTFSTAAGERTALWHDGALVDASGEPLAGLGDDGQVRLWHPSGAEPALTVRWREWLESHEVRQPFKQAHREIYLLTDAERATGAYSNRYAAHVVKQHQFNALCAARGWRNTLRLMVDDDYPPATLELPEWGLRAEFWVEGAGSEYGTDTNETGTYFYLATDQVRFHRTDAAGNRAHAAGGGYTTIGEDAEANRPLPLTDVPALVLSEVLRDVDLFVGVASVGNDPTWFDGGPQGRYRDYWSSYSFGELSESARSRREVLERLVPRLKIRDRCTLSDRFLVVAGDLRTYKIHLGSGNVLMEPNDQYLCIVAAQGAARGAGDVFLPFEGDGRMAVILSKAFLLAGDASIDDTTITSQIRR